MNEQTLREQLAATYRIFAGLGLDDLTYTHLSARLPGTDKFFIYPLGLLFEEVTASSLLKVSLEGKVLSGSEAQYNRTGYVIHGTIYRSRPEINAIFHLHTEAGIAVSSLKEGLLPLSQFAMHFFKRHAYYDYDSLALDFNRQGINMVAALGAHKALFLRNHGTLTCGETIQEAFFYAFYLERACRTQCAALSCGKELIIPDPVICEQAARDMRNFEVDLGWRDWQALRRKLEREQGYEYQS